MAEGGYEPIADALFNRLNVGTYCLEYDTERAGISLLSGSSQGQTRDPGAGEHQDPQLESKEMLKKRIR